MHKVLVTGANGQLGRCLQVLSVQYAEAEFHFMGREHLPINDFALVDKVIDTLKPDTIINAAAYTAVDKAEQEQDNANLMNGYAVGNLAAGAKRVGARFIHVSTDYVFDGQATEPYKEDHPTNPVNAYGASKLLGEHLAMHENAESVIIRTSWVYSKFGNNFVKTMVRLMKERESLGVVSDQRGAPTYAIDLAAAILKIGDASNWVPGIFHFSNDANISWYDFAVAIAEIGNFNCKVNAISTTDFPTPAKRPAYSVMDCKRIEDNYDVKLVPWKTSLEALMPELI